MSTLKHIAKETAISALLAATFIATLYVVTLILDDVVDAIILALR